MGILLHLPPELEARLNGVAPKGKRAGWIRGAIEMRLADVAEIAERSVLRTTEVRPEQHRGPLPKAPEGALRARVRTAPVSTEPLVPMPPAVRAAAKSPFTRDPADCPHKYRSTTDRCLACGDQR